jgi:GTP cyclohydrolase I
VVHLAYASGGQVVGFGALQALVDTLAHRLVLQEHLTRQLADALMDHLGAQGAAVMVEARHLCMILQGRNPQQARVITRCARGCLEGRPEVLPPLRA